MKEISLDGIWKLRADRIEDNPFGIKERMEWNMNIPGDVHDTLIKNNTIPDPYYGMNELDIQFIGRVIGLYTGPLTGRKKMKGHSSDWKRWILLQDFLSTARR